MDLGEHPSPYLPQEDWAYAFSTTKAPQTQEGRGGDCSALGCYGGCQLSPPREHADSLGNPVLACGLFCSQKGLESQRGDACEGGTVGGLGCMRTFCFHLC